jgi:hypothetical protein
VGHHITDSSTRDAASCVYPDVIGLAFIVLEIGMIALLLVLLNARDRRRARALEAAFGACPTSLRSSIALRADASLLRRRVVLFLDGSVGDDATVWVAIRPLVAALPPHVRLVIGPPFGASASIVALVCAG